MKNLVNIYNQLSNKTEGVDWYWQANLFCRQVAEKYDKPLAVVCAILSALSPATNFEQNKKDCLNMVRLGGSRGVKCGTYGANVEKARRLIRGKLLPENAFSLKTGAKTYNFYHNVLTPESTEHITIDRHALRIAGIDKQKVTPKQYREVSEHYKRAAMKIGILPSALQAVLWVAYRKEQEIKFKEYQPF